MSSAGRASERVSTDRNRRALSKKINILLVDDESANLIALEAVLHNLGHNLVRAHSGEEALRLLLTAAFALILLDARMPCLDGYETARLIRGRDRSRHTPIIFITAHEGGGFPAAGAYALGAVDFLVKPLVPAALRAKVMCFVELFQQTERVRSQAEQLRRLERGAFEHESLRRFRAIIEHSWDAILLLGPDGIIQYASPSSTLILGYPPHEFVGRSAFEFPHPEDLQRAKDLFAQLVQSPGSTVTGTARYRHSDGSWRWLEGANTNLLGEPSVQAVVANYRDVTDHTRVEEELREESERLQRAQEAGRTGTWEWDVPAGKVAWSRGLEAIHGLAPGAFPGTLAAALDHVHPEDRGGVGRAIARALEGRPEACLEYRVLRPDGAVRWVEGRGRLALDAAGKPARVRGVCVDVPERKRAERLLAVEHAVARALAKSATLLDAAPKVLQAVCEGLDWDVGVCWRVDRPAEVLRCVALWRAQAVEASSLAHAKREGAFALGAGLPGRVWAGGSPVWVPEVAQDANFPGAALAAGEGLHGAVGFPVRNGTEFLGVMEFLSREIRQPDDAVLRMMASVGSHLSQFIERRQAEKALYERLRELELARGIQQGFLPRAAPAAAGFAVGGASRPAQETGGDFFDYLCLADGSLALAVGDVSGHGVAAALLMAETCAYLRALALTHTDVARILALANRRLVRDIDSGAFVAVILARLAPGALPDLQQRRALAGLRPRRPRGRQGGPPQHGHAAGPRAGGRVPCRGPGRVGAGRPRLSAHRRGGRRLRRRRRLLRGGPRARRRPGAPRPAPRGDRRGPRPGRLRALRRRPGGRRDGRRPQGGGAPLSGGRECPCFSRPGRYNIKY